MKPHKKYSHKTRLVKDKKRFKPGEVRAAMANRTVSAKIRRIGMDDQLTARAKTVGAPASIVELSRALRHDVDKIYQWVYENIDYMPIWGIHKSTLGTVIDGCGGPFEQATLMVALLQEAGYTASYKFGTIRLTAAQIRNLLGTDDTTEADSTERLLDASQIPADEVYVSGELAFVDLSHIWVSVEIDGTEYVFDPSLKTYQYVEAAVDIATAIDFDMGDVRDAAETGASQGTDWVEDFNVGEVDDLLKTYGTNLLDAFRTEAYSKSLTETIGGRTIVPLSGTPVRQTSLPYQAPGDPPDDWPSIDDMYRATLSVAIDTIDVEFLADEVYGKRLTITFNGSNQAELRLAGEVEGAGSNALTPGNPYPVQLAVVHPFATEEQDERWTQVVDAGGTYLIGTSFGKCSQSMADYHRTEMKKNIAGGGADGDEDVLGEALATFWFQRRAQQDQLDAIYDQVGTLQHLWYHMAGVVGYNEATEIPYFEVIALAFDVVSRVGNTTIEARAISATELANNAMEAAVLQQNLPVAGISALQLLREAASQRIWDATSTNWTTVRAALTNWTSSLPVLDAQIDNGSRLIIHQDGAVTLGDFTGGGWLERTDGDRLWGWVAGEVSSSARLKARLAAVPPRMAYFEVYQQNIKTWYATGQPTCPYELWGVQRSGYGYTFLDDPFRLERIDWGQSVGCDNISAEDYVEPAGTTFDRDTSDPRPWPPNPKFWDKGKVYLYPLGSSGGSTAGTVTVGGFVDGSESSAETTTTGDEGIGSPSCGCMCDPISPFSGNFYYKRMDMSVGSGPYPYSLSFSRHYNSGKRFADGPLGLGWTHSLATLLSEGSNGMRGLGEVSPAEAAAAIAHAYVMLQIDLPDCDLVDFLISTTCTMWLMDEITGNAVTLTTGQVSRTFIKLVDGSFNPAPGYAETLTLDGTYTLESPQKLQWNFNSDGKLATFIHPAGVTVTYTYTSGKLTSVSNGLDRTLTLSYTGDRLTGVSDGNGRSISFTVDGTGNQTEFTDAEGNSITYEYSETIPGQMLKLYLPANPASPWVSNLFDTTGRVKEQTPANRGTYKYYLSGASAELEDPYGRSELMYFNSLGSTISEIDRDGEKTEYVRDGLNRLVSTILPEGNHTDVEFDENNNVTKITQVPKPGSGLSNIVRDFTYSSTWNKVATAEDGVGNVTSFAYDGTQGTLLTITRPTIGGQTPTVVFTFNGRGQVLTRTDETGIVDSFVYSSTDETLTTATRDYGTGRLNLVTAFGYNDWGDTTSITDPRGNETTFEFDNERRLTNRTECSPFGFVTNWVRNDNGELVTFQRQTGEVDPEFQEWSWVRQINGDVESTTDPAGNETQFAYDLMARLISTTDAENRQWQVAYDEDDRIDYVTDPMGNRSQTRTYTGNGMLAAITDARHNTTSMEYDGFDRLAKRTYPDGSYEQMTYNGNNQVLTFRTRAGETITNTFDVLTRLSTRTPGSLPTQTMGYDLASRLTSVSTPVVGGDPSSGAFGFEFDTAGRLITQVMPNSNEVGYQLDENGNRTRLIWPDGYYAEYVFDELNRMTDIKLNGSSTSAVHIDYDDLSRRTMLTYMNGASCAYTWAINNDLLNLVHEFVGSSVDFTYGFNKVHQVTEMEISDPDYFWTPDVASITAYATANNLNQYPSVNGDPYGYDNNGNLTSGPFDAEYDSLNRLKEITSGSVTNNYWIDPLNRQVQKESNSTKTLFLNDGLQLVADYDDTPALTGRYIPGTRLDEILVQINGATTSFLHQDRLGSVIARSNSSGAVLNKFKYAPFGETPDLTGTVFGFTGQRYDEEIGLYNYKARYYAPLIGRFLQPDPIGYSAGDLNLYSYVGNNPLNSTDPFGLEQLFTIFVKQGTHSIQDPGHAGFRLQDTQSGYDSGIRGFSPTAEIDAKHLRVPGRYYEDSSYKFEIQATRRISQEGFEAARSEIEKRLANPGDWQMVGKPKQCTTEALDLASRAGWNLDVAPESVSPFLPMMPTPEGLYDYLSRPQPIDLLDPGEAPVVTNFIPQ